MRDKDFIMDVFLSKFPTKEVKGEDIVQLDVDDMFRAALLEILLDIRDSILLVGGVLEVAPGGSDGSSDEK